LTWSAEADAAGGGWKGENDFESAVFRKYPQLSTIKARLRRAGAKVALMSGSGSALFGFLNECLIGRRGARFVSFETFGEGFPDFGRQPRALSRAVVAAA